MISSSGNALAKAQPSIIAPPIRPAPSMRIGVTIRDL